MKNKIVLISLMSLLLGCYSANTDILRFIEKREQCDYFRSEISGNPDVDKDRGLYIQLDKYCKGTDQALMQLKNKYKYNLDIIKKLDEYEEDIESK